MTLENRKRLYNFLRGIPVLGAAFRITNSYVFEGVIEGNSLVAPPRMWWDKIVKKCTWVTAFSLFAQYLATQSIAQWAWHPADTILAIFPSILGFGIGVYALLFIMPSDFFTYLQNRKDKGATIGPEIVPVDMGYPLTIFTMVMFIAVLAKVFIDNALLKTICLISLFYGLAMAVELLTFLFNSSVMLQNIRSNKKD